MQADPFDQFPSPYTGMGNDPINLIDPSGGFSVPGAVIGGLAGFITGGAIALANDGDPVAGALLGTAGGVLLGGLIGDINFTRTIDAIFKFVPKILTKEVVKGLNIASSALGEILVCDQVGRQLDKQGGAMFASNSGVRQKPTPYPGVLGSSDYYIFRYNDFLRRNSGIQPPSYYLDYGDKYLKRFEIETYDKLSKVGKQWLANARRNLQILMEKTVRSIDGIEIKNRGEALTDLAFKSHVAAYWDAGLKRVSMVDLVAILLTPDFNDLASDRGMGQALQILDKISIYWRAHPLAATVRGFELFVNRKKIMLMITAKLAREGRDPDKAIKVFDWILNRIPTIKLEW